MSELLYPKKSAIIGIFVQVQCRLFAFGCDVSLVIYWSSTGNSTGVDMGTVPNRRERLLGTSRP
jgi:hypothetical protein